MKKPDTQVPPKWVVRCVGVVLLFLGLALVYIAATNFSAIGWPAAFMILGGLSTAGFATASIYSGNPSWILLDLILPG